jgi:hypothetical protein
VPVEPPKFAVDRTLGRLARWLRLLGFDACLRPDLPAERLLVLAAREGRVVVTRDVRLGRRRSLAPVVRLASDRFREQLRELDRLHPLGGVERREPRCAECNLVPVSIAPKVLPETVPPYVRATQTDFRRCPRCRRIYWPATHRERMRQEITALRLSEPV